MPGHIKLYVSGIACICPYTHASGFSSVLLNQGKIKVSITLKELSNIFKRSSQNDVS
jgi:hypothetical protein